jgi:lysophospholipid acyltransferase (LPLAT)-like uncharacterized protein
MAAALNDGSQGRLLLLWHNRLFPVIGSLQHLQLKGRRIHALVSASHDGAMLSHFLNAQGIATVRGSSSRRGALAAKELIKILRSGEHVAITVDGPRGPCYHAQPGAAFLAALTKAPVVLLGAECERVQLLRSWDRFMVPWPFSRVRILVDDVDLAELSDRDNARLHIERSMLRITKDRYGE